MDVKNAENIIKALEQRLKHLLQSDIIRLYDRIDPRTRDYIHDVTTLDDYFESLKQQSRELEITRAYIHDKNLEYDLLVYSKNKEQ